MSQNRTIPVPHDGAVLISGRRVSAKEMHDQFPPLPEYLPTPQEQMLEKFESDLDFIALLNEQTWKCRAFQMIELSRFKIVFPISV
jgi:hypothetical protein